MSISNSVPGAVQSAGRYAMPIAFFKYGVWVLAFVLVLFAGEALFHAE